MRRLPLLLLLALSARADEVSGIVVDAEGAPVAGIGVLLEVGRARYALTPEFDRWLAVETERGTTGDDGRFAFSDLPAGAVATVSARREGEIGVARGAGALTVTLAPAGGVRGRIRGRRSDLKTLRVVVVEAVGRWQEGEVDKRTGRYEIGGVAPGPARIVVKRGNWDVARADAEVVAGEVVELDPIRVKRDEFLPVPDPLVDCTKARLVDAQGDPVAGVQLWWSSLWMDGGMASDEDGLVKLRGGGVGIGRPPYLLRLASLEGERGFFEGELDRVRGGVAIVTLRPLRAVTGTVTRGEETVASYVLLAVGPGQAPRVYTGRVEDGRYTVHVPPGACRLVVGTADGRTREHALEVEPGPAPLVRDLPLN